MSTKSGADSLASATDVGAVTLKVADLDAMIGYYRDGVGLELLEQQGDGAVLGRGERRALVLQQDRTLRHASPSQAGLYHTAFLFPEASELAASVYSVARKYGTSFTGSSDHLVSKALYFNDVEGNGVELYWDRPRDEWQWDGDTVRMGTVYLDPNRFLQENLTEAGSVQGVQGDAGVGHVHLKVGDIATAKAFYVDTLGFDVTAEFGAQALFVSAGGYHHHLGMNTWESAGAGQRTPALGLGEISIEVPSADDLGALRERLGSRGVAIREVGDAVRFDDPWANQITVRSAAS
ncbi:VOC family protein [Herbiconiux sp. L3-i23]|uniref:VOC family protein n=1 Tax=Herbiconiux sp. L3-i23 TaxID=2905871 RepID=UPI00204A753B|nr:VOC family protein [Herbiconiux sp. L3-i23]BDI24072.1 glyoxalase [Herbiconiux sp. L3-i23]